MIDIQKRRLNLPEIVFILFIVSATITGIGYYLYCLRNGIIQYTTYPDEIMMGIGPVPSLIRYSKDILVVILFLIIVLESFPQADRFLLYFIMFVVYGSFISLLNNLSFTHIFSGVRCFIYFVTGVLYFKRYIVDKKLVEIIYKITILLLVVQCVSIIVQVALSGINNIGNGSYRYIGLFLHTGTLGNYAYAIAIFLAVYHLISKRYGILRIGIEQCLCLLLSVASNSRLCIAGMLVNMMIVILSKLNIRNRSREIMIFGTVLIAVPIVLSEVLTRSGRGGLEASASGKFAFWEQAFSRDFMDVLIGNGLGYATQTTATLGINTSGYSGFDGTFSVIMAQFGIVGLIFFIIAFFVVAYKIMSYREMNEIAFKCNIVGGLFIFTWSGNIFENILLVTYYLLVYYMLLSYNELEEAYCEAD